MAKKTHEQRKARKLERDVRNAQRSNPYRNARRLGVMWHLFGTANLLDQVRRGNLTRYFQGERYNELTDQERAHLDKAVNELEMAMRRLYAIARRIQREQDDG